MGQILHGYTVNEMSIY